MAGSLVRTSCFTKNAGSAAFSRHLRDKGLYLLRCRLAHPVFEDERRNASFDQKVGNLGPFRIPGENAEPPPGRTSIADSLAFPSGGRTTVIVGVETLCASTIVRQP